MPGQINGENRIPSYILMKAQGICVDNDIDLSFREQVAQMLVESMRIRAQQEGKLRQNSPEDLSRSYREKELQRNFDSERKMKEILKNRSNLEDKERPRGVNW